MHNRNLLRHSCIALVFLVLLVVCAPLAGADQLVNGGVISGAISSVGEEDSHTFTANVGENVQIRVVDTSNNDFSPLITLYSPSSAYLTEGSGEVVGAISHEAPASGTYTVVVADGSGLDATGNYKGVTLILTMALYRYLPKAMTFRGNVTDRL